MQRTISSKKPQMDDLYRNRQRRANIAVCVKYAVLIIWSVATIYPFLWIINNAFRTNQQIFANPFTLPNPWIMGNLPHVWSSVDLGRTFLNSLFYSSTTTAIVLLISSMAAYVLMRNTKSLMLYIYFIMGIMIPLHATIIPLFVIIRNMGLMGKHMSLIVVYTTSNIALGVFILTGFIRGLPVELEESAMIDGASYSRTFFSIVFPLLRPALATVGTFVFLGVWNDFLGVLVFGSTANMRSLNLACYNLRGLYVAEYGLISAGLVILIVPVTIVYVLFQEQVIKGLTAGAVKG